MDDLLYIIVIIGAFVFSIIQKSIKDRRAHAERMRRKAMMAAEEAAAQEERENYSEKRITPPQSIPIPESRRVPNNLHATKEVAKQQPKPTKAPRPNTQKNQNKSIETTAKPTNFDFDIERAVIESEILKPKYTEY